MEKDCIRECEGAAASTTDQIKEKSTAIVEEYLRVGDVNEALRCVAEFVSDSSLHLFVQSSMALTLERRTDSQEQIGCLLHKLVEAGMLPAQQYYRGLGEILVAAAGTADDTPHIWLHLAELITPLLQVGGIPMGQLFSEISRFLLPLGKAAELLVQILRLLCKRSPPEKVGEMWVEAKLKWKDFLLEDEDVDKFVTEQKVDFTIADHGPVVPVQPSTGAGDNTKNKQNNNIEVCRVLYQRNEQKTPHKQQCGPLNPTKQRRQYNSDFLLSLRFAKDSVIKPEGLPDVGDVVLEKINKTPLQLSQRSQLLGPDFTPSYLRKLGGRLLGGPRGSPSAARCLQLDQSKEPGKFPGGLALNNKMQLNNSWKPSAKSFDCRDSDQVETYELYEHLCSILNTMTLQNFQEMMRWVTRLTIDTEEKLKGVIDIIFAKAISQPSISVMYAKVCHRLMSLSVPASDTPDVPVTFHRLLIDRCQKEFEDQPQDENFEKVQKESKASDTARRHILGNMKFIGELFKLKMLTEAIMHNCVMTLLRKQDEEPLECLCKLLTIIGKDLDHEKAKPCMDQYFTQIDKIIKERRTSSRIRFMLLDILDLRRNSWVPRRGLPCPKTIEQIYKETEKNREQIKVREQHMSRKKRGGGRMGGGRRSRGNRTPGGGWVSHLQDEGWKLVPISKNRPNDTTYVNLTTKPGGLELKSQQLDPGGNGFLGSWGKSSGGGAGTKPAGPATSTFNHFSVLQQSDPLLSPVSSDQRFPQGSGSSQESNGDRDKGKSKRDHCELSEDREDQMSKKTSSRELPNHGGRDGGNVALAEHHVCNMNEGRKWRRRKQMSKQSSHS